MKRNILFSMLFLFMIHPIINMLFSEEPTKKPVICILFGPPGTGPGDLTSRTSQSLSMPLISTAKLTLHYMKEASPLGKKVQSALLNEPSISEDIVLQMLVDYIKKNPSDQGYVIDGMIKSVATAKKIRTVLDDSFVWSVFYIDVRDDILKNRATGRRICSRCGIVYHLENSPPESAKVCDTCGGELILREDDKPEQFQKRLDDFHEMMTPLKDYFESEGILHSIDGNRFVGPQYLNYVFGEIAKGINSCHNEALVPAVR